MRRWITWFMMGLLMNVFLGACALNNRGSEPPLPALDRLLPTGMIYVAEDHLKALGFDPGPVDGVFTEQTAEAVRQYQRRYGRVVTGLLDAATRQELLPGFELPPD